METSRKQTNVADRFVQYYAAESLSAGTLERFKRVRDRALGLMKENGQTGPFDVIDIGCGAGTQALLWAELGHRVSGVDVNEALVAIARGRAAERHVAVRFDVGSATALPYADAGADVVLMPELLEHVPDWQQCLREAIRVMRPKGLLYLSTTNALCPRQQEYELPAYSWYPPSIKRRIERMAVTTHPHWVNHAKFPAVNWFTYFELAQWLRGAGLDPHDRFDVLARQPLGRMARVALGVIRALPAARWMAHVLTEGTTVWALRRGAN